MKTGINLYSWALCLVCFAVGDFILLKHFGFEVMLGVSMFFIGSAIRLGAMVYAATRGAFHDLFGEGWDDEPEKPMETNSAPPRRLPPFRAFPSSLHSQN